MRLAQGRCSTGDEVQADGYATQESLELKYRKWEVLQFDGDVAACMDEK